MNYCKQLIVANTANGGIERDVDQRTNVRNEVWRVLIVYILRKRGSGLGPEMCVGRNNGTFSVLLSRNFEYD